MEGGGAARLNFGTGAVDLMIIEPKVRGFICVTAHPAGCSANVKNQIDYVKSRGPISGGSRKVLVIGASTGYGLASRISAAFGCGAATLGVFFEKPGTAKRPGSPGWYNTAAFTRYAREAGLYARNVNGDAFSDQCREKVIEIIKEDLGQVDLVVYSLAAPVRKIPGSGEVVRSALKTIGKPFTSTAIDTNKDTIIEATVEPATEDEINNTVTVMGGQDWELWLKALKDAGALAEGCRSVAYSYIGTELTWPIYWHGTLGRAKEDLERAAKAGQELLSDLHADVRVAVLKSVVTQASAAIPVMPLYIAMVFRIMREQGIYESVIQHIQRLFEDALYGGRAEIDEQGRIRMDTWELRDSVQQACKELWPRITTENLKEQTDYADYKLQFLQLFGFSVPGVDYSTSQETVVEIPCLDTL